MKFLKYIIALYILWFSGCNSLEKENRMHESLNIPKVIFDTDMGSDCDDVGALALLHYYAREKKVDILGCIYSSGKVPYGAGVIDAINHYYGRPDIPIGATYDTIVGDPVDKMGAEKLASDTAKYGHQIVTNQDALEQTFLSRKLLAQEEDNSVVYITVGHTKGLYDLLVSEPDAVSPLTGKELVKRKIKRWVALGALNADNPEGDLKKDWNFFFNGAAPFTEFLIENFPRPSYFIDGGSKVITGKSLMDTPEGNVVRQAYTDWLGWAGKTLEDQRPSWDLVAVNFAIEGLGDYLEEAEQGSLFFDPEKGCIWVKGTSEQQHHLIKQKAGTDSLFAAELNEKIADYPR